MGLSHRVPTTWWWPRRQQQQLTRQNYIATWHGDVCWPLFRLYILESCWLVVFGPLYWSPPFSITGAPVSSSSSSAQSLLLVTCAAAAICYCPHVIDLAVQVSSRRRWLRCKGSRRASKQAVDINIDSYPPPGLWCRQWVPIKATGPIHEICLSVCLSVWLSTPLHSNPSAVPCRLMRGTYFITCDMYWA